MSRTIKAELFDPYGIKKAIFRFGEGTSLIEVERTIRTCYQFSGLNPKRCYVRLNGVRYYVSVCPYSGELNLNPAVSRN
jgi:hypothetical protein